MVEGMDTIALLDKIFRDVGIPSAVFGEAVHQHDRTFASLVRGPRLRKQALTIRCLES
jgi:hypothetical protein